ncbi:hypothetical protein IFM89_017210 [Coptis chinensis]|uniref:Uncharacterized protein n=1 Tax=Coptis chinensis TaxID=261450 RepID=A0A835I1I5_9MAGN|nr:hypothetical protein IFM89_017210 [Coptis chinensis]
MPCPASWNLKQTLPVGGFDDRIKINMQASQGKTNYLNSQEPSPTLLSKAYTPALSSNGFNLSQQSPISPQLVVPGSTPALSVSSSPTSNSQELQKKRFSNSTSCRCRKEYVKPGALRLLYSGLSYSGHSSFLDCISDYSSVIFVNLTLGGFKYRV